MGNNTSSFKAGAAMTKGSSLRKNLRAATAALALLVLVINPYPLTSKDQVAAIGARPASTAAMQGIGSHPNKPDLRQTNTDWEVYFTDPVQMGDPLKWDQTFGAKQHSIEYELIQRINAAQKSIHIASFELDLDPVVIALVNAKKRGVDVKWVTDDEFGCHAYEPPTLTPTKTPTMTPTMTPNKTPTMTPTMTPTKVPEKSKPWCHDQFLMLKKAGIDVHSDKDTGFMHNKFWIFDSETVWTGSTNITESGIFDQNNNTIVIRSTDLAKIYEAKFERLYNLQKGSTELPPSVLLSDGKTTVEVRFSPEHKPIKRIIEIVNSATSKDKIRFLAFGLTDNGLGQAIISQKKNGLDVQGVFDSTLGCGSGSELVNFTNAITPIPVRRDGNTAGFLHDKVIIVGNTVITGSFNFSANATNNNDENLIIITNQEIAKLYMQEFDRIWDKGTTTPCPVKETPTPSKN